MIQMLKDLAKILFATHGAFVIRERRQMPEIAGDAAFFIDPKNIDFVISDKKAIQGDVKNVIGDLNKSIDEYKKHSR